MKKSHILIVRTVLIALLVGLLSPTDARDMTYNESPLLAERVEAGEHPTVEERPPENPLIIDGVDGIGVFGGKLVEIGPTREFYREPLHPYTESLVSAVPKPDPLRKSMRIFLQGNVPDPVKPSGGCYFHPSCQYAQDLCASDGPPLRDISSNVPSKGATQA